jgi:uncharacterized paraquat-inducible protein A
MVPLLLVACGIGAALVLLIKGELRATSRSVLRGRKAQTVAILLLVVAAFSSVPLFVPMGPGIATPWAIAAFAAFIVVCLAALRLADVAPALPAADAPLYAPAAEGPQLVGAKCAACDKRLVSAVEAAACKRCEAPIHKKCRKAHAAAHA